MSLRTSSVLEVAGALTDPAPSEKRRKASRRANAQHLASGRQLFQSCYRLLKLLCKDCPSTQAAVQQRLPLMLSHMGVQHLNVADTIGASLQDNYKL